MTATNIESWSSIASTASFFLFTLQHNSNIPECINMYSWMYLICVSHWLCLFTTLHYTTLHFILLIARWENKWNNVTSWIENKRILFFSCLWIFYLKRNFILITQLQFFFPIIIEMYFVNVATCIHFRCLFDDFSEMLFIYLFICLLYI